ncbi:TIR domain-containing protein [Candidatus Bathyarchaeota archaeon]|nr:TIR domain-containing protein [Candidatus Bathyarchaeota archaeon]
MGCSVFISYATCDFENYNISEIARSLEATDGISRVIYYQREKYIDIIKFINENIRLCDVMVLFCSKEACESDYVSMEWMSFLKLKKPVIPIFTEQDQIPPLLTTKRGVQFDPSCFGKCLSMLKQLICEEAEITKKLTIMRNFFGLNVFKQDNLVIALPVFYPLSRNEFLDDSGKTIMKKKEQVPNGLVEVIVPVYHRVIVMEDMHCGEQIKELLALYDIEASFKIDELLLEEYEHPSCFILVGGRRSNLKQNEIFTNVETTKKLIGIRDNDPNLKYLRIFLVPGSNRSFTVGVGEEHGLGIIYRVLNPENPMDKIVGLFGDRADTTSKLGMYFKEHFEHLSSLVEGYPSFIILVGFRGKAFSESELLYVGTTIDDLYKNDKALGIYLRDS